MRGSDGGKRRGGGGFERTGFLKLPYKIEICKLKWYGHMRRMEEDSFQARVTQRIQQGRSRKRWMHTAKERIDKNGEKLKEILHK